LAPVQALSAVVLAAVAAPVRAGRADQKFCRFESDDAGLCARVIIFAQSIFSTQTGLRFALRKRSTLIVCAYSNRKTGIHPRIKSEGMLLWNTR
jgi:hypothetical protein